MSHCKYSANHECDESCEIECRLWRAIKPSVEWPSPVRVLEVDGPKQPYVQRGEGAYYLLTNNRPLLDGSDLDERLKDWEEPHWEIIQNHDGTIEIHACRPTEAEVRDGDLLGDQGSVIHLHQGTRYSIAIGRRLARKLCRIWPSHYNLFISLETMFFIRKIETNLPVELETELDLSTTEMPSKKS
jgi:hypothetical protein